MFNKYLKIALRNLQRRKVSTAITATGLILGISSFLFILQYVAFEFSVNTSHENRDRMYRIVSQNEAGEITEYLPPAIAYSAAETIANIEAGTRISSQICNGTVEIDRSDGSTPSVFNEGGCAFGDNAFYDVFTLNLIDGTTDLDTPNSIVLTADHALKYFGKVRAAGEKITLYNQFGANEFTVTGVIENLPPSSSLQFNFLLSFSTLINNGADWANPFGWDNGFAFHFLTLHEGTSVADVEKALDNLAITANPNFDGQLLLQPFNDIHLGSGFNDPFPKSGSLSQVILLLLVGMLIMVIGWANYINLSTAQGLERAKQVGIQQTAGASKVQLMGQFFLETFLFTLFSLAVALALVELLQPQFNQLVGKELHLSVLNQQYFWIWGMFFFLVGTFAAGGYVSFVLTSLKPGEVLKGARKTSAKGFKLRKALVVFQFSISIVLIVVTLVFNHQIDYMLTRDLGMSLENRLVIQGPSINKDNQNLSTDAFKETLGAFPFVLSYTGSNSIPGYGYNFYASGMTGENPQPGDEKTSYAVLIVDETYLNTYEIDLVAGRNFNQEAITAGWNTQELVINEAAARELGYNDANIALGKMLNWGENQLKIVGVIEDYHHASLQNAVSPLILQPQNSNVYYSLEILPENLDANLAQLKETYEQFYPGNPFNYFFAEQRYDRQYQAEQRFRTIFLTAALLAIFIACLGLFGLAAYTATARTKEIGVRKVLGATVFDITFLLTRDFIQLVVFGFIIAAPIAWFLVHEWLKNFAYTIDLGIGIFLLAGFLAFSIAVLTVAGRSIQAARLNPVKSLRSE